MDSYCEPQSLLMASLNHSAFLLLDNMNFMGRSTCASEGLTQRPAAQVSSQAANTYHPSEVTFKVSPLVTTMFPSGFEGQRLPGDIPWSTSFPANFFVFCSTNGLLHVHNTGKVKSFAWELHAPILPFINSICTCGTCHMGGRIE